MIRSFPITDNAYVGLIVHLALAIERIMQGEKIEMDQMYLKQLKQEPEYDIAQKIITKLMAPVSKLKYQKLKLAILQCIFKVLSFVKMKRIY